MYLKPGTGHATRARQRAAVSVRHLHTPGRSYTLIRRVALDRVGTCHVNEYVTHFLKFTGYPATGTRRQNGLFACFYIAFMNVYSQQSVRHYTKCDDHYTKCVYHYTNLFQCRTSRSEGRSLLSLHEHLIVRHSVRFSTFPTIITRTYSVATLHEATFTTRKVSHRELRRPVASVRGVNRVRVGSGRSLRPPDCVIH